MSEYNQELYKELGKIPNPDTAYHKARATRRRTLITQLVEGDIDDYRSARAAYPSIEHLRGTDEEIVEYRRACAEVVARLRKKYNIRPNE